MSTTNVTVTLEGIEKSGSGAKDDPLRALFTVQYGAKSAQIEIEVGPSLFKDEPGIEVYRRDLSSLLDALEKWEASAQPIS